MAIQSICLLLHVQKSMPFYGCSDVQTYLRLGSVLELVLGLGLS